MKPLVMLIACGMLAGCDYTVPLVTTPSVPMDGRITGLWQRVQPDGKTEAVLILPLDRETSLVSFPAGTKDSMYARACLCRVGNKTLAQLQWFGTASGTVPDNDRVYQFADYTVTGEVFTIRLMNSDVVKRDAKSYDELATAIAENTGKTNLFREAMVFKKVTK